MDVSREQLRLGAANARKAGVELQVRLGDAYDLGAIAEAPFDLVIAIASFQYVPDLGRALASAFNVLRPGGRIIFSIPHPVMDALDASVLSAGAGAGPSYAYRGPVRWKWEPEDPFEFVTYRRTVADIINQVIAAGFRVQRIEELMPVAEEPQWSDAERRLRTSFPSFLVVEACKE